MAAAGVVLARRDQLQPGVRATFAHQADEEVGQRQRLGAQRGQAAVRAGGEHGVEHLLPGDLLPDAEVLLAEGGPVTAHLGVVQQESYDEQGSSLLAVRLPRSELNRLVSREGWESDAFIQQHTLQ